MPNYQEMYKKLFQSQIKVIKILQEIQLETEEMYVTSFEKDEKNEYHKEKGRQ